MTAGDIVIFTPEPLLLGGEMLVIGVTDDNRLLCEAIHWDEDGAECAPPRGIFAPHDLELAARWAAA